MFAVVVDRNVDVNVILLVVDNGHVIFLVDVTGDDVFPVVTVNGDVFFLVVDGNEVVVFLLRDAVCDLRLVVPNGISHNILTSAPLPPEKSHTPF